MKRTKKKQVPIKTNVLKFSSEKNILTVIRRNGKETQRHRKWILQFYGTL